jgi:hypothetical protein
MLTQQALIELVGDQFSCMLAQWRRHTVFLRSQYFFNGRVLNSPAPWSDKIERMSQRAGADTLALVYDCSELHLDLCAQTLAEIAEPWSEPWHCALESSRGACLEGLVHIGRDCLAR